MIPKFVSRRILHYCATFLQRESCHLHSIRSQTDRSHPLLPTRLTVWLFVLSLLILPLMGLHLAAEAIHSQFSNPISEILLASTGLLVNWGPWPLFGFQAGLLLLCFVDARLAREKTQLRVRRDRPARLSLGVNNEII